MSLVVSKTSTVDLREEWWPEGETISILRKMPWGAKSAIDAAMFSIKLQGSVKPGMSADDLPLDAKAEIQEARKETLRQMIVSWALKDDDGNAIPCTAENIDALDAAVAQFVYDEIQVRNPKMTSAQKNATATPATSG